MEIKKTYDHQIDDIGRLIKYETENFIVRVFVEVDGRASLECNPKNPLYFPKVNFYYDDNDGYLSLGEMIDVRISDIDKLMERLSIVKEECDFILKNIKNLKEGM